MKMVIATAAIVLTSLSAHAALDSSVGAKSGAKSLRATPMCSWDRPGHNPFMGDIVAAVDRYPDISPDTRARLKERMAKRQYDDIVVIKRDTIAGRERYDSAIRSMHFGERSVCDTVSRTGWSDAMEERGLVYCEGAECILVPTVCRNVSRISRLPTAISPAALPPVAVDDPFMFPPPGAGPVDSFAGAPADAAAGPLAGLDAPGAGPSSGATGFPGMASPGLGPTLPARNLGEPSPTVPGTPLVPGGSTPDANIPPVTPVPEPGTWALMAAGIVGLVLRSRRINRRNTLREPVLAG